MFCIYNQRMPLTWHEVFGIQMLQWIQIELSWQGYKFVDDVGFVLNGGEVPSGPAVDDREGCHFQTLKGSEVHLSWCAKRGLLLPGLVNLHVWVQQMSDVSHWACNILAYLFWKLNMTHILCYTFLW